MRKSQNGQAKQKPVLFPFFIYLPSYVSMCLGGKNKNITIIIYPFSLLYAIL